MNAFEIVEYTKKYFPLIRKESIEFDTYINSVFTEYKKIVNESKELFECGEASNSEYIKRGRSEFISSFNLFIDSILIAIKLYLEGYPGRAYLKLSEAMEGLLYEDKSIEYMNGFSIVGNGSYLFYRIRESDSKHSLKREELFHVPFSQRRKINTNRFSIPGLPSLYLSDSIYVAWEELGRPKFDKIHASRFELSENFRVLDLTTQIYCRSEYLDTIIDFWGYDRALASVFKFPLILACAVKVNNSNDVFRPEYIVPQMLLQWIKANSYFDGICYTTSHIDYTNSNFEGSFRNFIIPALYQEGDYCPKIKRIFKMTEVISAELVSLSERTIEMGAFNYENVKVQAVEIIKGQKMNYSDTKFASLEKVLSYLPATRIDFI